MARDEDDKSRRRGGLTPVNRQEGALREPDGVSRGRNAFGQMVDMAGRRMKTDAATRVQESENRFIAAQETHGKALEGLMRQADRVTNIEAIIDDDREAFETEAERNRNDHKEAIHETEIAHTRRHREALKEEYELEMMRRQLNELRSPPEPKDDRARIAELTDMIETLTEQLAGVDLDDERRQRLKKKRRALNDELDLLKARK